MTILSRAGNPEISYPDYVEYRDRSQAFAGLAASLPTESRMVKKLVPVTARSKNSLLCAR
jgi:hypothetical protein